MTNPTQLSLEEVLDMLLAEFETPSRQAIAQYSALYPHFRQEILEFAATWAEQIYLPEANLLSDEQEAIVAQRAHSFLQNALFGQEKRSEQPAKQAVPASLAQLAEASGQTPHEVARLAGLDEVLMSKLNARRIKADSVPQSLMSRLAAILRVQIEQVTASLSYYEGHRPGFAFLASAKPAVPKPEDFASAVMSSSLSDEEKEKLVSAR